MKKKLLILAGIIGTVGISYSIIKTIKDYYEELNNDDDEDYYDEDDDFLCDLDEED